MKTNIHRLCKNKINPMFCFIQTSARLSLDDDISSVSTTTYAVPSGACTA
jgi:hypothetical protein